MGVWELSAAIAELAEKARARSSAWATCRAELQHLEPRRHWRHRFHAHHQRAGSGHSGRVAAGRPSRSGTVGVSCRGRCCRCRCLTTIGPSTARKPGVSWHAGRSCSATSGALCALTVSRFGLPAVPATGVLVGPRGIQAPGHDKQQIAQPVEIAGGPLQRRTSQQCRSARRQTVRHTWARAQPGCRPGITNSVRGGSCALSSATASSSQLGSGHGVAPTVARWRRDRTAPAAARAAIALSGVGFELGGNRPSRSC